MTPSLSPPLPISVCGRLAVGGGVSYSQWRVQEKLGVPWWLNGLRIWHCRCCGVGLIPGPGIFMCRRCKKKKKRKKERKKSTEFLEIWFSLISSNFSSPEHLVFIAKTPSYPSSSLTFSEQSLQATRACLPGPSLQICLPNKT